MNIKVGDGYYCANTLGLISNDGPLEETSRLSEYAFAAPYVRVTAILKNTG